MYYEEKIIDGRLKCRYHPDGDWETVGYNELLESYENIKKRNKIKSVEIHELKEKLGELEQLAMDCKNDKLFV